MFGTSKREANQSDEIKELIGEALSLSPNAIPYYVKQKLALITAQKEILESDDYAFDVAAYAKAGFCTRLEKMDKYNEKSTHWDGKSNQLYQGIKNGYFGVIWQDNHMEAISMTWRQDNCRVRYYWILAETTEVAENFFSAVCKWYTEIKGEILVFDNGRWSKEPELLESIKTTNLDSLILAGNLKQDILNDLTTFFDSRERHETFNVPWKRGILFIGKPGNGKTHALKGLINKIQKPCLYVKSFDSYYNTSQTNIRSVFERARQSAPCIVVLEDLDSLINEKNRSFFLNEVDGFASNHGIVILATTNHPERIDTAIIDRAGRFDRKYVFELPGEEERASYIKQWNARFNPAMRLSDDGIDQIAKSTEGFSFSFLKELVTSSQMKWGETMEQEAMDQVMNSEVAVLRKQTSDSAKAIAESEHKSRTNGHLSLLEKMLGESVRTGYPS